MAYAAAVTIGWIVGLLMASYGHRRVLRGWKGYQVSILNKIIEECGDVRQGQWPIPQQRAQATARLGLIAMKKGSE